MKHIVNLSGGVCSFWAAHRVIQRYGTKDVKLLFADVCMEDEDLYRFNTDISRVLGVPIPRISKELTQWQLFELEGMIGNSRMDLCSRMLKRELLDRWHRANCIEFDTTLYIGIDWTEEHRLTNLRQLKPTWRIEAPMCEPPLWDKCKMLTELRALGIQPPRLYVLGFPHNNCGGFCVKAGQAQFALLLKVLPERYAWHEAQEEKLRGQLGNFSILSDRKGGTKKPLPLKEFRRRVETGDYDAHEWGGCGCALDDGDTTHENKQN